MDTFLFWLLSMLEYFAIFFFMFRLFTFRVKEYIPEIVFSSIILTFVSDALRNAFDLGIIDPLVQILLFCALLWQVFKVHIFYALIMSVTMAFYSTIQALVIIVMSWLGIYHIPFTGDEVRVLQIVTVLVVLLLSTILQMFKWRYSFVPTDVHLKVKYNGENIVLLVVMILLIIIVGCLYYFYIHGSKTTYIWIDSLAVVGLLIYLYFVNKKEYE